ncbi:hypothetical protein BG006_004662 [Podila minutissima]|uniref:Uncharacterized protein n=1 Tax=Podila minutissima TaxID=64525 RepID=A0A9P5SNJ4_9FUNG|nr:hypothetical protein BG006_004662 [Podila minutissima]
MSSLTPSQATKVLEDILMLLTSPPTQAPAGPLSTDITLHHHHHLYQSSTTIPSLNRLVDSILVLDNIDTLPFVEVSLTRIYNILFAALQQSSHSPEPQLNTSLMIVDMLISAGHIALYQTRNHLIGTPSALGTGSSMVFQQLVCRVLEPMPRLVHMSYSSQYFTQEMKARLLSNCELVLSSIMVSTLKAVEQYDGASGEHLSHSILACARVFDETLLQLHTSIMSEMTVDHVSLISGAFALLRLMDHFSTVPEMQQAKSLMMPVLCSSDILEWTILSIQTCPESNQVQMLHGFLEQVVKFLDLFVESQDDISTIRGDRMPPITYCTGLNGKPPDHIESALADPEPLVRHRIMEGLNATLGSADSIAHSVLGRHIESIQLWLWKTAKMQHPSRSSDLLLSNLLLDWVTRRAPDKTLNETQQFGGPELNAISMHIVCFPEALKALKTLFTDCLATVTGQGTTKKENALPTFQLVCSTVERCSNSLQEPLPDVNPLLAEKGSVVESHRQFLGRILSDCLDTLAKGSSTTEEATHKLFRGIHTLRAKTLDLVDVPEKLYNTARLLVAISTLEVMGNSTQTMFEEQPLMASTLWECIQEIMDKFTQHGSDLSTSDPREHPHGFGLKFLVIGMRLILVGHLRTGSSANWFGLDDMALMSYYAIELCKRTRSCEVAQGVEYAISAKLSLSVLRQVAKRIQDYATNRTGGDGADRELWDKVGVLVECMLDLIWQDLVVTVKNPPCNSDESRVVWKVLGVLRAIMNDLTTLVSQAPATNNAVHSTRPPEVPLDLFLWVHSKLVHPGNGILLDGLMHRWMEEAMRLKKIEEEMMRHSSYVHPLVLRSGWKELDQAGFDILSIARMILLMTSHDPRSMPSDSSMPVVAQWLQEFLQDPVVSSFYSLHQSLGRNSS